MRKSKVRKQYRDYYKDYYLTCQKYFETRNIENYFKEKLDNYISICIREAEKFLEEFKEIKNLEKNIRLSNEEMKELIPPFVYHLELYNFSNVRPYRYIELYNVYSLFTCFEIFNNLNILGCKERYFKVKRAFEDEIARWRIDYLKYEEEFNWIDIQLREEAIFNVIKTYSFLCKSCYDVIGTIMHDFNLTSALLTSSEEELANKYKLYYMLPEYTEDEEYKASFEKLSETMLEELDLFVNEDTKLNIETDANEYLEQKRKKPLSF